MAINVVVATSVFGICLLCGWPDSRVVSQRLTTPCLTTPCLTTRWPSRAGGSERIGIAAMLASLVAHLRAGGTGFEPFTGTSSSVPTEPRAMRLAITAMVARHASSAESDAHESSVRIARTADEITVAHRLSLIVGCEEARCIEAVAAAHRRSVMVGDLRDAAFAVPKATVNLLLVLPFGTLMLEELSGARPVGFLMGSPRGLTCLLLGLTAYAMGTVWMRYLLRSVPDDDLVSTTDAGRG